MPIPLIVWALAIGGSTIGGAIGLKVGVGRIKDAKEKYARRRKWYDDKIRNFESKRMETNQNLESLGVLKLESLVLIGEAIKFLENAKMKERDILEKFSISKEEFIRWKNASVRAVDVLKGTLGAVSSGVATASAAYGLVGLLGAASTGTAISTLSGAAAANATLAWLGGGAIATGGGGMAAGTAVFGGLLAGPALLVMGFAANVVAGKIENQVQSEIAKLNIDIKKKETIVEQLIATDSRIEEVRSVIRRLSKTLKNLLKKGNPSRERDAYRVARVAKALADSLESKILDDSGTLVV